MSIKKQVLLGLALLALPISAAWSAEFKPGEVIVKYKDGSVRVNKNMNRLYDSVGITKVRHYGGILKDFEHLIFDKNADIMKVIAELEKDPMVEYAEPNVILSIPELETSGDEGSGIPCIPGLEIPGCDPKACLLPGFPPNCGKEPPAPGEPGNPTPPPATRPDLAPAPGEVTPEQVDPDTAKAWGLEKIGALEAQKRFKGSRDIVVGVVDTGADYNHEDLRFNLWQNPKPTKNDVVGFDFVHGDGLPYDDNEVGHGTHTAGTIGAVGGNGIGVIGVSPRVSIMVLKFLSSSGSGGMDAAMQAIEYGVANGAKILSNSWGMRFPGLFKGFMLRGLEDAIAKAQKAGVLFVAAAGNDGKSNDGFMTSFPATFEYDNIISVAATDSDDKITSFSNFGKKVHIGAPGAKVYSLIPGNKYKEYNGTSMATPHVSGAAALLWAQHPSWNYLKVKEVLLKNTDPFDTQGKEMGGGRLNVLKALSSTE